MRRNSLAEEDVPGGHLCFGWSDRWGDKFWMVILAALLLGLPKSNMKG